MAPYGSEDSTTAGETEKFRAVRRKAARYIVPVAVTGIAAATIGLVPAIADSGDPDLPDITARQLIEKIAASDTERMSGTFRITTDLGLPDLGGLAPGLTSGALAGGSDDGSAADPSAKLAELVSGTHTMRVAVDGDDKQKLSLLENASEYSLIHNGEDVWGYDSKSNAVYHATADEPDAHRRGPDEVPVTPKEFAEEALKASDETTSVTVDGTAHVAGRDAYRLLIKPKQSGTTVGAITVVVDAETGTPLKFTLTPASGGAAVLDVGFTQVSFARPAAATFDFTPPKGAKVTEDGDLDKAAREHGDARSKRGLGKEFDHESGAPKTGRAPGKGGEQGPEFLGEGWNSVAVLDTGGKGVPSGGDLGGFMGSLGDEVTGKFGSGTVFKTRLINALITDDGKVYVGAVTKDALVKAADSGA